MQFLNTSSFKMFFYCGTKYALYLFVPLQTVLVVWLDTVRTSLGDLINLNLSLFSLEIVFTRKYNFNSYFGNIMLSPSPKPGKLEGHRSGPKFGAPSTSASLFSPDYSNFVIMGGVFLFFYGKSHMKKTAVGMPNKSQKLQYSMHIKTVSKIFSYYGHCNL